MNVFEILAILVIAVGVLQRIFSVNQSTARKVAADKGISSAKSGQGLDVWNLFNDFEKHSADTVDPSPQDQLHLKTASIQRYSDEPVLPEETVNEAAFEENITTNKLRITSTNISVDSSDGSTQKSPSDEFLNDLLNQQTLQQMVIFKELLDKPVRLRTSHPIEPPARS